MNVISACPTIVFQNPEQKPLEDLQLVVKCDGIPKTIPALDKHWAEKRCFLNYEAPNLIDENGQYIIGAKEQWLELASYILDDLIWLLRLPFYKFWSNVIYNKSIVDSIVTFLQDAPTTCTLDNFPDDYDLKQQFDKIRQNILIVFARLVTNKESPTEFISLKEHGHVLYNKYIFTVPILMDLCQQYGHDNRKIIEKVVNTVFTLQPLYREDLEKAVTFIVQALRNIERRFEDCPNNQYGKAVPLSERGGANVEMTLCNMEDIILYIIDTVSTINIFLDIYSPAIIYFRNEHFLTKIISVYSNTMPEIYKKLANLAIKDETIEKYLKLKHFLDVIRIEILNIYRNIIFSSIQELIDNKNAVTAVEMDSIVEDFLTNLMFTLSEKEFVIDYHNIYPVIDDFSTLMKIYPNLDTVKCEFIINSIFTFVDDSTNLQTSSSVTRDFETLASSSNVPNKILKSEDETNVAGPSQTSSTCEIESSLISEVKDIFSDLGEGFIEKCLKYYNNKTESVINAILEDSLPVELKSLDRSLPIIPPDPEEASAVVDAAIGVERLNIYDNDEFDVMTKDNVDTSRIHRGKRKDKYKNLNELLNDKSHIAQTKDVYNKYSIISNEYDDEYDDTYDDHDIGSSAQDDVVEVDARPFTIPRVLRKQQSNDFEDTEEYEFDDGTETQTNKDNFVQDPALLRAKAEERRLFKQGSRSFYPQNRSVVGNPKGQGQTKDVLDSRTQKGKNKATRANHNRRTGSQCKRNQGMVP